MDFGNSFINIHQLCLDIGANSILNNISLDIYGQDKLGIVGANGAGKTSLLRCLYRYYRPCRGKISINGQDIFSIPSVDYARRLSALCNQRDEHFDFYVHEVIHMADCMRSKDTDVSSRIGNQDYRQWLKEQLQLDQLWCRSFNSLSAGEKQRVMIAQALWNQAEVVILDEPTCYLDIYYRQRLLEILYHHKATLIVASHDLDLVDRICNRVVCMQGGYIATSYYHTCTGLDNMKTTPRHDNHHFQI